MTHLTPDELIDVLDDVLTPATRAHLEMCAHCQREAAQLRAVLGDARAANVPEPSPLFWDHLSARVQTAIADDATPPRIARWFEWPVLAPIAALALLVIALVSAVPTRGGNALDTARASDAENVIADDGAVGPDSSLAEVSVAESQWALVAELVGNLDVDAASDAGIATFPGAADRAVMQLTSSEQQELLRLLQEELKVGS